MNAKTTAYGWLEVKDYDSLSQLKFTPQGPRHTPVPHDFAIAFFKRELAVHNIEIVRERAFISPDTMRLMFIADVRPDGKAEDGFTFSVGFLNNNDRSRAFTGLAGTTVYINNASWYVSDKSFKTRHVTSVRELLAERIAHIIAWFKEYYTEQSGRIEIMKKIPINNDKLGSLLLFYMREKYVLSSSNLNRIVKEWDEPEYGNLPNETLWDLQNTCAQVFKRIKNPLARLNANECFDEWVDFTFCGDFD